MRDEQAYTARANSTRVSIWVLLGMATLTWSAIWAVGREVGHLILG
jgi:hypothetical protein